MSSQRDRNVHIVVLKENKTTWNWRDNKEQTLETETIHQLYEHVRFLKFAKLFEVPSKTMGGSFWMIVLTFLMNFEFDRSTWLSWLSLSDSLFAFFSRCTKKFRLPCCRKSVLFVHKSAVFPFFFQFSIRVLYTEGKFFI